MAFDQLCLQHQQVLRVSRKGLKRISDEQVDILYDCIQSELLAINDLLDEMKAAAKDIRNERMLRSMERNGEL